MYLLEIVKLTLYECWSQDAWSSKWSEIDCFLNKTTNYVGIFSFYIYRLVKFFDSPHTSLVLTFSFGTSTKKPVIFQITGTLFYANISPFLILSNAYQFSIGSKKFKVSAAKLKTCRKLKQHDNIATLILVMVYAHLRCFWINLILFKSY